MAASFPGTIVNFTTKQNVIDVVDASHVDALQDEVHALEFYLGVNPHISGAGAGTFATVKTRLDYFDVNKSQITHTHIHSTLTSLDVDDHTDATLGYMRNDGTRHDLIGRHTFGAALPVPAVASTSAVGDAAAAGGAAGPARADHVHGREAFATTIAATTAAGASAPGTAVTVARGDHVHGLTAAIVGASAPGDAAVAGTATSVARSDHVHARESFAVAITAMNTWGAATTAGTAGTVARGDHNHGTPQISSLAPTTSTPGDTATVGTSNAVAREDHRHGREGWATTVVAQQTFGLPAAVGTSTKQAREDHSHGTPDPTLQGPTGVMVPYVGAAAPSGWLLCQGQNVSRTTYAALYAVQSDRYGAGDGSTTFTLPDMRNATVFGIPAAGNPSNATGWASHAHSATSAAGAAHNHGASSGAGSAHNHTLTVPGTTGAGSGHQHGGASGTDNNNHTHSFAGGIWTGPTSSNHTHGYIDFANYGGPVSGVGRATDGQSNDHQHTMSGFETAQENQYHTHNFTTNAEASHTHGIGAASLGSEAGHTHSITTSNESTHTHGVTVNASGAVFNAVLANWIVKT